MSILRLERMEKLAPGSVAMEPLPALTVFVESREDGRPQGLTYKCPCGCGGYEHLNLDPGLGAPCWTFDEEEFTVAPSVLNHRCKAHYFIRGGCVHFV